jgi:N-acetylneuraminate synthase
MKLLEAIKQTGKPVIISTGMSTKKEVDNCVIYLGDQIEYILACTSTYPTPTIEMNMNFIKTLKEEYRKYKIGFSNHNPGIMFCAVAGALGAEMIELHVTLDRSIYGSDQASSIEPEGIIRLGKYIRSIEEGMGNGLWAVFPGEIPIKKKLRR